MADFLNNNPFGGIECISQKYEFDKIPVQSVSVIELPVDDFVKEYDFVLSTAIGCLDDDNAFKNFIKDIKKSKASALFLSFKDSNYKVSSDIINTADEEGLPVFTVPWRYKFSDISDFITNCIYEKKTELYKIVQDKLFNAYFTSKSLKTGAEIISSFLCVPVAITDKFGDIKAVSHNDIQYDKEQFKHIDIRINEFLMGYIYVCRNEKNINNTDILKNNELIEKYICLPLSLWFNRESIENMVVFKLKNDFVWDLANGRYESFAEMSKQGLKLGFNLYKPYTCIAFKIASCKKDDLDEYSHKTALLASKIEDIITECGRKISQTVMLANKGLLFVIYIENTGLKPQNTVDLFAENIEKALKESFNDIKIYCGISEVSLENADFSALYNHAMLSLHYCENSKDNSYRFTYRDTKIFRIISALQKNDDIHKMAFDTVNKLLDYDKNSDIDLIGTLIEFINSNYNISQTARKLHIHRQSLLYRLDKIESVASMSLQSRKDLFLLEIFTRIYRDY